MSNLKNDLISLCLIFVGINLHFPAYAEGNPLLQKKRWVVAVDFNLANNKTLKSIDKAPIQNHYHQVVFSNSGDRSLISLANRIPETAIAYIEEDVKAEIATTTLSPNDQLYTEQWNLHDKLAGTDIARAWEISTGSTNSTVAIIDSGILFEHEDLQGRLLPGFDFVSLDNVNGVYKPYTSNDGDGRDNDPSDPGDWIDADESSGSNAEKTFEGCSQHKSTWHGTHMAGIIAANSNNKIGTAGINWHTKILPLRALGKCGGYISDIADAIRFAAGGRVQGPDYTIPAVDVINLSLSRLGKCSKTEQSAIDFAVRSGVPVIVAAGNAGGDAGNYAPANCNNVIVVGATDENQQIANYSNQGDGITVFAPGGYHIGILAAANSGLTNPTKTNYSELIGTSMAAAQVSGIASLIMGLDPQLTPANLKQRLTETAIPMEGDRFFVNAFNALQTTTNGGVSKITSTSRSRSPLQTIAGSIAWHQTLWLLLLALSTKLNQSVRRIAQRN